MSPPGPRAAPPPAAAAPLLAFERVSKRFGERRALEEVSVGFRAGEIHALLGENGAGKTTLARLALGWNAPDGGRLVVDGQPSRIASPAAAEALGFSMVHQHFALAEGLTVAENLALGRAPAIFSRRRLLALARDVMRRHGLEVDAGRRVADLAIGEKQRVEILKALERGGRLLILDEPTAVLAPAEVGTLLERLTALREQGRAIVLITHKLDEALAIAQRFTVLRAGRVVLATGRAATDAHALTHALFGGAAAGATRLRTPPPPPGARVLAARGLAGRRFGPVTFELRAGECVGIAGVDGHGQSELLAALVGLDRHERGELTRPREGVSYVSGDRHGSGLALDLPVAENVALRRGLVPGRWLERRRIERVVTPLLDRFDVRSEGPWQIARRLSGGNQQKVVLARELATRPALLLAENPTRGLDLQATAFVRQELRAAVSQGAALLVASTDLDEVLELADRLFIAWRGELHACDRERAAVAGLLARLAAGAAAGARN